MKIPAGGQDMFRRGQTESGCRRGILSVWCSCRAGKRGFHLYCTCRVWGMEGTLELQVQVDMHDSAESTRRTRREGGCGPYRETQHVTFLERPGLEKRARPKRKLAAARAAPRVGEFLVGRVAHARDEVSAGTSPLFFFFFFFRSCTSDFSMRPRLYILSAFHRMDRQTVQ